MNLVQSSSLWNGFGELASLNTFAIRCYDEIHSMLGNWSHPFVNWEQAHKGQKPECMDLHYIVDLVYGLCELELKSWSEKKITVTCVVCFRNVAYLPSIWFKPKLHFSRWGCVLILSLLGITFWNKWPTLNEIPKWVIIDKNQQHLLHI